MGAFIVVYCFAIPVVRQIRSPRERAGQFWTATAVAVLFTTVMLAMPIVVFRVLLPSFLVSRQELTAEAWSLAIPGIIVWWELRFRAELLAGWQLTPRAGRLVIVALTVALVLLVTVSFAVAILDATHPRGAATLTIGTGTALALIAWIAVSLAAAFAVLAFPVPWVWYNVIAMVALGIGYYVTLPKFIADRDWRVVDSWFGWWYRRSTTPGVAAVMEQILAPLSAFAHLAYARHSGDEAGLDTVMDRARVASAAQRLPDDLLYGALTFPIDFFLASALLWRYDQVHSRESLSEAIVIARRLNARWWLRGPARGPASRLLSGGLRRRHARDGDPGDLEEATRLGHQVPGYRLPGAETRARELLDRYRRDGDRAVLQEASVLARLVAAGTAPGAPRSAARYILLAETILERGDETGARRLLETAAQMESAQAVVRLRAAARWGHVAARAGDDEAAVAGMRAAVELLPRAAWRGMLHTDQRWVLADWPGLPGDAAAAALRAGDPRGAVELLEAGRAIMWSQVTSLRATSLGELAASDPGAYARLGQLRVLLDSPLRDGAGAGGDAERRTRLAREFDSLLAKQGLMRALSFGELSQAASAGPVVVVNISQYRCDALIITPGEVTVVELDPGCHDDLGGWLARLRGARPGHGVDGIHANRVLAAVLEWVWDAIVCHVLVALGRIPDRLWWCPVGRVAELPLHAAGYHLAGDGRALPESMVCSYTPSLGALLAARSQPRGPGSERRLVVALEETPGAEPLPFVRAELAGLPFEHDTLSGAGATVAAVADTLPGHEWAHFACHGLRGADLLRNGIVLHDGVLTPYRLAELPLGGGELAYLSACDTAALDEDVADEVIHPAAVLHLTGYRHVIASLGPVHDAHAPGVAHAVYAALLSGTSAAVSLHQAVSPLRSEYPSMPALWSRYIHIGP